MMGLLAYLCAGGGGGGEGVAGYVTIIKSVGKQVYKRPRKTLKC